MFGSAAILFFSLTGLTLNHPDWFFEERQTRTEGTINVDWLNVDAPPPADWDEYDFSHEISRLEVSEYLRQEHALRGAVSDFLAFEDECEVTFQAPGYSATARIQRDSGTFDLEVLSNDLVSVMNDLHKGRHSGAAWSWVIDLSAIVGTFVGLTGFVLIFFLKRHRKPGIIAAIAGLIVFCGFYYLAVS